ncbi:two-component regulator propeller domain-containing protein [Flammeovirgaceae bacterium SG7u.111]|nr:two-component regulator propeller domain-containing protein [Flammeovirgaceae bacterium SG7u.132]WPO33184.1 two-component regulator propeller domain-containing protein [Flammeovirgaceae bacterium SG7u.111]
MFKRNEKLYWIIICCCLFAGIEQGFCQSTTLLKNPRFKKLDADAGLSSMNITSLYEDKEGYIWVGTEYGLNKYDGYTVQSYLPIEKDSTSIMGKKINVLLEDENSNLWIGTNIGLSRLDKKTGKFSNYVHDPQDPNSLLGFRINCLLLDPNNRGRLWIGGDNGFSLFDISSEYIIKLNEISHKSFVVSEISELPNGHLLLCTSDGVYEYDVQEDVLVPFGRGKKNSDLVTGIIIHAGFEDSLGNMWFVKMDDGIIYFNKEQDAFFNVPLLDEQGVGLNTRSVHQVREYQGMIVVGTGNGLNILPPEQASQNVFNFKYVKSNVDNIEGLSSHTALRLLVSSQGILWVGTWYGGINVLVSDYDKFKHYKHVGYDKYSLSHNIVHSFIEDQKGNYWVATDGGGLGYLDTKTQKFYFKEEDGVPSLSSNKVVSLFEDHKGGIWAATWRGGANYIHPDLKTVDVYYPKPNTVDADASYNLIHGLEDRFHKIWFISHKNGLECLDPQTKEFSRFCSDPSDSASLSSNVLEAIYEDKNGELWIGSDRGLNRFNRGDQSFERFVADLDDSLSLQNDYISYMYEDSFNRFWVCTKGGLYKMDREKKIFEELTKSNGLASDLIFAMVEDHNHDLWITTNNGISKLVLPPDAPLSDAVIQNYDISDGLQSNQFAQFSIHCSSQTGHILAGGVNGFNMFHPDSISVNTVPPKVYLTSLKLFNKEVAINEEGSPLNVDISYADKIELDRLQSVITFSFTAINFIRPEKNQFAYKLENFDKQWNYVGQRRDATYTNLPPGEYTFRVKASNNDGVWNEEGVSILVIRKPTYWETFWFWILLSLALLFITFAIIRYRFIQIKRAKKALEYEVMVRTKEVVAQNEELQSQQEELESQQEELSTQYENLGKTLEELKKTQSTLVQSEKMASLGLLTAGIAHEINNPINFIKSGITGLQSAVVKILDIMADYDALKEEGFAEEMEKLKKKKEELKIDKIVEITNRISHNISIGADRAAEIVKGLRLFSRLDEGGYKEVDLAENIDSALALIAHLTKDRIGLVKNYGKVPMIESMPGKLNQVFMNILVNAVQSIEGKGQISISILKEEDNLVVRIRDTGCGMPEEVMKKIFDPFFTTKDVGRGTGLGLSIVKGIIDEHGGKIVVKSEVEKGTEFMISLPISSKHKSKSPTQ